jgi:ABC-type sugar transport system substrate-binding protein
MVDPDSRRGIAALLLSAPALVRTGRSRRLSLVWLFAAALIAAVVCLSGCGERETRDERIKLGFSQLGSGSSWRRANTASIQSAAETSNIRLLFDDAQGQQANQIIALREFIRQKVDVIAISPIVRNGWDEVLREAKAAGIPVIVTDRPLETADESLYISRVGPDFAEEGRRAGRWLVEHYKDAAEDVNIVELRGAAHEAPTSERKQGFEEGIAANPRLKLLRSEDAHSNADKAREIMARLLQEEGQRLHVVFVHHDNMALAAINAIEAAGLRPAQDIVIVSIDGERTAFKAMVEGKLNVTVECSPLLGPLLMTTVTEIVAGKPVARRFVMEEAVFPMDTAATEIARRQY